MVDRGDYLKPSGLPRLPRFPVFSLQVERLSKSVVAKRAELQNLEAESSAKQARSMVLGCGWRVYRLGADAYVVTNALAEYWNCGSKQYCQYMEY